MSILPFQTGEVASIYNRISKLNSLSILEKEKEEPQDVVDISSEARKRQVIEQAKTEILKTIRKTV